MVDIELDPGDILIHEFEYAQSTAEQAQDDRTAILNLYLLLVGGVGSIIVGLGQSGAASLPRGVYVIVFALLGVIGFFILFKLVRLRQAWYDSVRAMNQIKDFYLDRFPDLAKAFRWRTQSIPPRGKIWTITFGLSILVMIIDSVAAGVAAYFADVRLMNNEYAVSSFAFLLFFLWQIWFYFFQLRER
jgi:membrane protein YdbS with pleckstrin-like domain